MYLRGNMCAFQNLSTQTREMEMQRIATKKIKSSNFALFYT